jgi:uncharacterized protein YbjQ (UPF0145 family)
MGSTDRVYMEGFMDGCQRSGYSLRGAAPVAARGFTTPRLADTAVPEGPVPARKFSFCRGAKWCSLSASMSQTHPLTTTTFELPGYRVARSFGVVRGIVVRSRSIVGNFGAQIQSLFGGNISLYTSLCERAREDAFNQMITHAGELGANAVIGVRYDATEIGPGISEVLCYGTAVYVERAG